MLTCKQCGGEIPKDSSKRKFCCKKCLTKFYNEMYYAKLKARGPKVVQCRECGVEFESKFGSKICSEICRAKRQYHSRKSDNAGMPIVNNYYNREKCYSCSHWLDTKGPHVFQTCSDYLADRDIRTPFCYKEKDFSSFVPIPEQQLKRHETPSMGIMCHQGE